MTSEIIHHDGRVEPFAIPEAEDFINVHGEDPVTLYNPFQPGEASGYYYWRSKDRAFRVELWIDKVQVHEIDVYNKQPAASDLEPSLDADYHPVKIFDEPERYIIIEKFR
tara:strand:+ start:377 stop:706 length:330 start_codon:yes stop_codon:yes gene_type:complete